MISQTMLGVFAVMALWFPTNLSSASSSGEETRETDVQIELEHPIVNVYRYLIEMFSPEETNTERDETETTQKEKSVTPQVSTMGAAPTEPVETPLSPKEQQEKILAEWLEQFPKTENPSHQVAFIETIAPAAVLIGHQYDVYPSVMMAQAALESSWGQSGLAQTYNNLMGTKGSWNGESVTVQTREDVNGQSVYIQAGFSVYDSWADSLHRYGVLMQNGIQSNPEIYRGTWRSNAASYQDATAWLQGRYATDTTYANKLNRTIESFQLAAYDDIEGIDDSLELLLEDLEETQE